MSKQDLQILPFDLQNFAHLFIDTNFDLNQALWGAIKHNYKFSSIDVRNLISTGLDMNTPLDSKSLCTRGETLLTHALQYEPHNWLIELLLVNGADPNKINNQGRFPLVLAAIKGFYNLVQLLLDHGANINQQDQYGNTVLRLALLEGHKKIAKLLIYKGANIKLKLKKSQTTILVNAIEKGFTKIVKLLLDRGAKKKINQIDQYDYSSLSLASVNNHPETIKLLVQYGADINYKEGNIRKPCIYYAVTNNHHDLVKFLLDNGCTL